MPILILFAAFIVFFTGWGMVSCTNHQNSHVLKNVTTTVVNEVYSPAHTETTFITDSNGNSVPRTTTYPESWDVTFQWGGFTHTIDEGTDFGGLKMGDHVPMVIREGGFFKDQYLWDN